MAEFELRAGAKLNLLSPQEFDQGLKGHLPGGWEGEQEARGRGIKLMRRIAYPGAAISGTAAFTLPETPEAGYVWSIRLVGVRLSAAGTSRFYLGFDNTPSPSTAGLPGLGPSSSSATSNTVQFGDGQLTIFPGEYIVTDSNNAATLAAYIISGVQVPAELAWKIT